MLTRVMTFRSALLAAALLVSHPIAAQAPAEAPATAPARTYGITESRTAAGLRLVHLQIPDEKDQVFALAWRDRLIQRMPDKAGLLTLAPSLVANGGAGPLDAGAFEEELRDIGGSVSLNRTRTATLGQIAAPAEQFEAAAMLMRSALMKPRLPRITLERQKRFRLSESRAARERPQAMAQQALALGLIGDHPLASTVTYRPETTISDVAVTDVDAWRKAVLAKRNLTIVSAGPLSRDAAAALADRVFGDLPAESAEGETVAFDFTAPRARTIVIERPVEQSVILAGGGIRWPTAGPEGVSRGIATAVLGGGSRSRLFAAIRERLGAAYGASASVTAVLGPQGIFAMDAAVSNDKVGVALAAMRNEYELFRERGVTAEELEPIKRRLLNALPEAMRRAGSAASTIRGALLNGSPFDAPDRQALWVRAQTPERVNALIRERLPERLTTIVVTPSAAGLGADCVIASLDELHRCR